MKTWKLYLSGEIHTDWREQIEAGCKAAGLPVSVSAPSIRTMHETIAKLSFRLSRESIHSYSPASKTSPTMEEIIFPRKKKRARKLLHSFPFPFIFRDMTQPKSIYEGKCCLRVARKERESQGLGAHVPWSFALNAPKSQLAKSLV